MRIAMGDSRRLEHQAVFRRTIKEVFLMDMKTREEKGAVIVEASGRLDAATTGQFEAGCAEALQSKTGSKVILDFSGLEYISSAGLRSLLSLAKKLKATGGSLTLCNLTGIVKEVINIAGFDQFLPVCTDLQSAIQGK